MNELETSKKNHVHLILDVEASGQCPGLYDMISLGLIVVEPTLDRTFYAEFAPLHDDYMEGAYKSIGVTREQHLAMPAAERSMIELFQWVSRLKADRITIWSDNNGFDWSFLNWYVWWMLGDHSGARPSEQVRIDVRDILNLPAGEVKSPFGHSSRRIGDVASGLCGKIKAYTGWKKHRKTTHTHRADDDARGNAEAFLHLLNKYDQENLW